MVKEKHDEYGFLINPSKSYNQPLPEDTSSKSNNWGIFILIVIILYVLSMFLAGFISWNCYAIDLYPVRVTKTILASIFSYPYLAYFFILRVLLKVPCFS